MKNEIKINPIVKTPQELIHIQHSITLHQYKCWLLMLRFYRETYESKGSSDSRDFYQIPISKIEGWIGYYITSENLKKDLEAIRKEPIIFNALNKDGKSVVCGSGFISEWELSDKTIGFKLPDFLRESIENLDLTNAIFLKLNWSIFNSFAGKYEAIVYKLCKDYVGVKKTPVMSIDKYRDYIGLKDSEFVEFKALNRYAIAAPVKKINESLASDILIEVDFKRGSTKKIVSVQFLIKPKYNSVCHVGDDPAFTLARVVIPIVQQDEYLSNHSRIEIQTSIERANEYIDKLEADGNKVGSIGAVYRRAIEENWGLEYQIKKERESQILLNQQKVEVKKKESLVDNKIAELKQDFLQMARGKAIKNLDFITKQYWIDLYINEVGKSKTKSYQPEKMEFTDKMENSHFNSWLRPKINPPFDNDAFALWAKETRGIII